MDEYDETGTDFSFEAAKDNVLYELEANGWSNIDECDRDRNYPTSFFAEKAVTISISNADIDIIVQAGYTAGYYQAANFDWIAKVKIYSDYDVLEYAPDELEAGDVIRENWYGNIGLSKIHAEHIIKKIASIIDDLKNEAEIAFSKYCDEEMYCSYRCFNGEAGYSKTGKRLWQEVEEHNKKKPIKSYHYGAEYHNITHNGHTCPSDGFICRCGTVGRLHD